MECEEVLDFPKDTDSSPKKESEDSVDEMEEEDPSKESSAFLPSDEEKNTLSFISMDEAEAGKEAAAHVPRKRGRKPKIYNVDDSPETIKEKRKKRAVELKLSKLKWTLNEEVELSGKRQKKAPQRFELSPVDKRKSCVDDCQGRGMQLGNISWIHQHLQSASLYTLRLLHRTIYRKQGMFSEKHIRKSVIKFSGFPFDGTHEEIRKRREQLERTNVGALGNLCDLLAIRRSTKDTMINKIIGFLLYPNQKSVDDFLQSVMAERLQQSGNFVKMGSLPSVQRTPVNQAPIAFLWTQKDKDAIESLCNSIGDGTETDNLGIDLSDIAWKRPVFFSEGNGVKLKFIRAVATNIQMATDSFIELLHRLLYLNVDERNNMRRSILEFSGLKCDAGTSNYIYRMRILSLLSVEQVKLICRVLCLPTWHRSRQLLTDGIMDFLAAPRISAMKKRVPPHFADEITFSFDTAKVNKPVMMPELKSDESEEIEIFPDIHIPDDCSANLGCDFSIENEYLGIKLKNFSNIHYQVISTPAAKLNDVHMILYLTTSAQNNIRKNVLEFSGFPFDDTTPDFECRRNLMEQMSLEDLKTVATVLCVSQYIVDESKNSLIDAILKFLLKPSALLNSSTIMPTISPAPSPRKLSVVKKKATSTSLTPQLNDLPEIVISEIKSLADSNEKSASSSNNTISSSNVTIKTEEGTEELETTTPELEKMKACLSSDIQILPVPLTNIKIEQSLEPDVPLSKVMSTVSTTPSRVTHLESDDEDDKPLSKMIGHPNDDQLRILVTKIVKESKLEDITMKSVIRKVFDNYPNFDLGYRKEFIKSIVRQILSQMDDQACSVTTTVINI